MHCKLIFTVLTVSILCFSTLAKAEVSVEGIGESNTRGQGIGEPVASLIKKHWLKTGKPSADKNGAFLVSVDLFFWTIVRKGRLSDGDLQSMAGQLERAMSQKDLGVFPLMPDTSQLKPATKQLIQSRAPRLWRVISMFQQGGQIKSSGTQANDLLKKMAQQNQKIKLYSYEEFLESCANNPQYMNVLANGVNSDGIHFNRQATHLIYNLTLKPEIAQYVNELLPDLPL